MMDPKMMAAFSKLVQDASGGGSDAQQALRLLGERPLTPDAVVRWMNRWLPTGGTPLGGQAAEEWIETWYTTMGVVPRSRYTEALERADQLRIKLEEAEQTIRQLQSMVGVRGQEDAARSLVGLWQTGLHQTLQAQNEWLRRLSGGDPPASPPADQEHRSRT
ncbi:MAG: hypothetical protein NVS4B8_00760 [Herpetosiphon sp.]